MNPIDCNCPHWSGDVACGASKDEPCKWVESEHPEFHAERILAPSASNTVEIPKDIIDKAAEEII